LNRLKGFDLLLAATRHVVIYFVLAFATIELVWIDDRALASPEGIVAIPTVDDVSVLFVNHIALQGVVAQPAVDDVVAVSSPDVVITAKAAYFVLSFLTGQRVYFVSA
jgi:hypothetical protein